MTKRIPNLEAILQMLPILLYQLPGFRPHEGCDRLQYLPRQTLPSNAWLSRHPLTIGKIEA
ncbi:uncharacterized protein BCR38DRAFT_227090 [Pseudomassariella vexata]|uniref:Uncharacterized protein n=1 Tax=Pseudomassariella vexata TaxID=1141098 RepID=A0A1Y2DVS6_9PEZI|nr:uncharacterized protein BCR38DRAFT_227090 [Pseudomassariella vexata]ORY63358.1 hypothetical protein BCR38DRAFT_227090 [Pseudomassariella vexata]